MRILGLYHNECAIELFQWLEYQGNDVAYCTERLESEWCKTHKFDLTLSYTYRYILTREILETLGGNVVNLHNSYLPWNRGADPNLWSIVENTPRGVTLHYMDTGLDKGAIIAQKLVGKDVGETLRSSYEKLDKEAKKLFKEAFAFYRDWPQMKKIALGVGTYHAVKDGKGIKHVIDTYDITVTEFKERLRTDFVDIHLNGKE